jgi:hypothetical protein
MRIVSRHVNIVWLSALLGVMGGCLGSPEDSLGTVNVNLVGRAPSGATYRLRNAIITVTGAAPAKVWNTEDEPDQTSLSANVATGDYVALLQDGWRLDRVEGTVATPVWAELTSANPVQFTVSAEQRTVVPLQFRVDAEPVDMAQGYDIVIAVQDPRSPVVGVLSEVSPETFWPGITMYPSDSSGDQVPLRNIVGPANTLLDPRGVIVVDDQIIVADTRSNAVASYPIIADGEVGPTRRIVGPATTLDGPRGLAVLNGELYVADFDGIVVFPLGASGNLAPTRRISRPPGTVSVALHHDDLYVVDWPGTTVRIVVYSATDSGTPTPKRILTEVGCATELAFSGDEMFVADTCRGIAVYPATASGNTAPLRMIWHTTFETLESHIAIFRDELYLTNNDENIVRVFPIDAAGDIAPTRSIVGEHTGLGIPTGVFVH